jgi:hypothetical protein
MVELSDADDIEQQIRLQKVQLNKRVAVLA